jgi:hypothetical protein
LDWSECKELGGQAPAVKPGKYLTALAELLGPPIVMGLARVNLAGPPPLPLQVILFLIFSHQAADVLSVRTRQESSM